MHLFVCIYKDLLSLLWMINGRNLIKSQVYRSILPQTATKWNRRIVMDVEKVATLINIIH